MSEHKRKAEDQPCDPQMDFLIDALRKEWTPISVELLALRRTNAEKDAVIAQLRMRLAAVEQESGDPPLSAFDPAQHEGGPDGVLCLHFSQIPESFFEVHALWESAGSAVLGSAGVLARRDRYWRPLGATWAQVHAAAQAVIRRPQRKVQHGA